jgi:murein DD-endopeptidase MepM/ murein hydrolase activator NlpD
MRHSKESLDQIRKALRNQGINSGEILDEMMDHYLSEVELAVSNSEKYKDAVLKTINKIQHSDFTRLKKRNNYKNLTVVSLLVLTVCTSVFYLLRPETSHLNLTSKHSIDAPDGWPLLQKEKNITSTFGMREHPIHKTLRLHKGVDIRVNVGEEVLATGHGVIEKTGYNEARGNFVIIRHNDKYSTCYNHLETIKVSVNDLVKKGALIGTSGNSGSSFGPHLHYEIIESNVPIDPLKYART